MIRRALLPSLAAVVVLGVLACEPEAPVVSQRAYDAEPLMASASSGKVNAPTSLGTFGGDHGAAFDINDAGEVAGETHGAGSPLGPPVHAVFWSKTAGVVPLASLGGENSETRELNNERLVVGRSQKEGDLPCHFHPTAWRVSEDGKNVHKMEVGTFGHGELNDVNESRVVVGWGSAAPAGCPFFIPATAFRWTEKEGFVFLPPVAPGANTMAFGINEAGDVVGRSAGDAVVWWADGTMTVVASAGGNARATAINDRGEVVGSGNVLGEPEAFYWSKADGLIPIGKFGGLRSFAFEIDNAGRVAGFYDVTNSTPTSLGERRAFVWTKSGETIELPTLGGTFASSGDINAEGDMTGRATDAAGVIHAVIWKLGKAKKDKP